MSLNHNSVEVSKTKKIGPYSFSHLCMFVCILGIVGGIASFGTYYYMYHFTHRSNVPSGYISLPQGKSNSNEIPLSKMSVSYTGMVKTQGPSIYMQGSHELLIEGNPLKYLLLQSKTIDLALYEGKRVTVAGPVAKTVEGNGRIMRVTKITEASENKHQVSNREWKIFTNDMYSIAYPASWYVNTYVGSSNFRFMIEISDVEDSYTTIQGISDIHTRIDVSPNANDMPTTFPYTNGGSINTTIIPFSTATLSGIRGKQTSEAGVTDVVYLKNPKGGYVEIILTPPITGKEKAEEVFTHILSSFRFIH